MKKYATVGIGKDYRQIARIISKNHGIQMNHTSTRNYFLKTIKRFASELARHHKKQVSPDELAIMAENPEFQEAVQEIILEFFGKEEIK